MRVTTLCLVEDLQHGAERQVFLRSALSLSCDILHEAVNTELSPALLEFRQRKICELGQRILRRAVRQQ